MVPAPQEVGLSDFSLRYLESYRPPLRARACRRNTTGLDKLGTYEDDFLPCSCVSSMQQHVLVGSKTGVMASQRETAATPYVTSASSFRFCSMQG